jgi:tripartite-type tricarboxylate transporter receptor subunit TctC
MMRSFGLLFMALAGWLTTAGGAFADWPKDHPITLIVPYAAGGPTDVYARLLGKKLGDVLGQTIVVQNRPAGGGTVGPTLASQAAPDGYTFLLGQNASHGTIPNLYKTLGYDPIKSFAPIIYLAGFPNVLVAKPDVPFNTVQQLIDYAKANPGALNYGASGKGTTFHLGAELFKTMAGVNLTEIEYSGGAATITALLGGQVDLVFADIATSRRYIEDRKLKAIATTGEKRSPALPNLPTVAETKGMGGFRLSSWFGLFAPAGTPPAIITTMNADLNKILGDHDVNAYLANIGGIAPGGTPDDLKHLVESELKKWRGVIAAAHVVVQ